MRFEDVMNYVVEKLKEPLLVLETFGGQVLNWFDTVFPPETRGERLHHWLQVALPFLIAAAVLIMCICCCKHCCRGGRAVKMMKAPGRNIRMPRHVFQSNPTSYFRNLRAYPGDMLV